MSDIHLDRSEHTAITNVLSGKICEFSKIVDILKLNPKKSFKFSDLSSVDFGNADLTGYDFTGSDLRGSDLTNSKFSGAILPDNETVDSLNPMRSYYAYSKEFDQIVDVLEFVDDNEIAQLYSYMKKQPIYKYINSLIISGKNATQLAITFLADCSGSMRGPKIATTMVILQILTRKLEEIGVSVEVLGFTTRAWKGGQSRELWLNSNRPANPGRLNDLRHLIIKPFKDDFASREAAFAILMREGILKENIDGEAVFWAFRRLVEQKQAERCLFVISDGAPVDDSTLAVNQDSILADNLKSVIRWIEKDKIVNIGAVGLGFDVAQYYSISRSALDASSLPIAIIAVLKKIAPNLVIDLEVDDESSIGNDLKNIKFTFNSKPLETLENLRLKCRIAKLPFPNDEMSFIESWGREARRTLVRIQSDFPELSVEDQIKKLCDREAYSKVVEKFRNLLVAANQAQIAGYIDILSSKFTNSKKLNVEFLGIHYSLAPAFREELQM